MRWFAVLRERRGADEEQVQVAPGTTAAALYRQLLPPGPQGALPVMFAVDRCYVPGDTVLEDGVEVVFVPPLGGG
ncbi:MAG: MoaD/ThiS family protein [Alphaproteobacteria bacterium]|nr:MoaD/ThiS family protein [Alphaproteobacteria bacterium]